MTRWTRIIAALLALGTLPALAVESTAEMKDRAHEGAARTRMKLREAKPGKMSSDDKKANAKDATKATGARAARTYHKSARSVKQGFNHMGKQIEKATK